MLVSGKAAADRWFEELQRRQEFFKDMTDVEITEYHMREAVKRWHKWFADAQQWAQTHKYDAFCSWFDANYPEYYDDHVNEVWRRVRS